MKLKEYRKLRGLSRAKFGKLIGVSGLQVWRYETGRTMPKPEVVQAIAGATQGAVTAQDCHDALLLAADGKAAL